VDIKCCDGGVVLSVKVVPGSSKTAVVGELNGMLKVKLSAPPERGKANQCLIEFLAKRLDVKKNTISIVSGHTNPVKRVQIAGVAIEDVLNKIAPLLGELTE